MILPDMENGIIKLVNVGRINLYLCGYDMLNEKKRYKRPH